MGCTSDFLEIGEDENKGPKSGEQGNKIVLGEEKVQLVFCFNLD